MGGKGSGRTPDPEHRKRMVEDCITLDFPALIKAGIMTGRRFREVGFPTTPEEPFTVYQFDVVQALAEPTTSGATGQILRILHMNSGEDGFANKKLQIVPITATRLRRGGLRYWLSCPGFSGTIEPTCGKRVAMLYLPKGSTSFACRGCHDLVHMSQMKKHGPAQHVPKPPPQRKSRRTPSSPFKDVSNDVPELSVGGFSPFQLLPLFEAQQLMKEMGFSENDDLYLRISAFVAEQLRKTRQALPSFVSLMREAGL